VVNVPLVDVTEENGATIYYPGTHKDTRIAQKNKYPTQDLLAEWTHRHPAERLCCQQGDIVIRDSRMWHGGMPNNSSLPRTMITMGHAKPWFDGGTRFEKGCEGFFEHPLLRTKATFVAPPIPYMYQGSVAETD
jgi:hypothetical protein